MTNDALIGRITNLEHEGAIERLLYDYARFIDYGDDRGWLSLFEEDAVLELRYRPGLPGPSYGAPSKNAGARRYHGQAQLATFITDHSSAPDCYHKHVVTNPRIDLLGDTAQCESYFQLTLEIEGAPTVVAMGRYRDDLRLAPDGRWRFVQRVAEVEARRAM